MTVKELLSPPSARHLARFAACLALGTLGGAVFYALRLPLPWMLGAMCFTLVGSLARWPIAPSRRLRPMVVVVIGVALGSSFAPGLLHRLIDWLPLTLAVVVATLIMHAAGWFYLRRVAGFDADTAFFAAAPGGIYEMSAQGAQAGADERRILVVQAIRIFLVVLSVPISLKLLGFVNGSTMAIGTGRVGELEDAAILVACGLIGWPLALALRLPNPPLIGPMLLSALAHGFGATDFSPPSYLVAAAQVGLGTSLGGQFKGFGLATLAHVGRHAIGVMVLMMLICLVAAGLVDLFFTIPPAIVMLTVAPGGIAEMSLMALAMKADVAMVTANQLVRILLVQFSVPPFYAWLRRRRSQPS